MRHLRLFSILAFLMLATPAFADPSVPAGSTSSLSQCIDIAVRDTSVTTSWSGLTGLAYNSGSLVCYYHRDGASSATAITLASSTLGTFTSGAFKEVSSSNMPGVYQLCLPDAAVATGAYSVSVMCKGATNMEQTPLRVMLTSPNSYGYDGKLAGESGTSLTLASGAIDADDQFAYVAELAVFDTAGLLSAVSCIVDSTASSEVVVTAEDISALVAVNDNYIIRANSACRNLRPTTAGNTLDVTAGGNAGVDLDNIAGTLDAAEIATDAITAAKIAADAIGASELATDAIGAAELAADAIGASEIATDAIGAAELAASAIGTSEFAAEADVNAEVLDVLNVDTFAELSACPATTATLTTMIRYLYEMAKHKLTQSSTTMSLYKDDGSTLLCSGATSDSGSLFTRAELN